MGQVAEKNQSEGTEIAVYRPFWDELEKLKSDNEKLVFQYHTPKGNKEARSHIYNLRKRKADIERARKAEKAEALEYGRQVDSQAKTIAAEYEAMIEKHQKPLDEIEAQEAARIEAHKAVIAGIVSLAEFGEFEEPNADQLESRLAAANQTVITGDLEEFEGEALKAKESAIERLSHMLELRQKYEAEQAELDRLRVEKEERERKEREAAIAREAAAKAKAEAEEVAKKEREQAERRERELKEAAAQAERDRIESERRAEQERVEAKRREEQAAKDAEERTKREAEQARQREKEEAERREANKRHKAKINNGAVAALVNGGMDKEQAKLAVTLIAKREVPAVTISY